jgi:hypothetical protein
VDTLRRSGWLISCDESRKYASIVWRTLAPHGIIYNLTRIDLVRFQDEVPRQTLQRRCAFLSTSQRVISTLSAFDRRFGFDDFLSTHLICFLSSSWTIPYCQSFVILHAFYQYGAEVQECAATTLHKSEMLNPFTVVWVALWVLREFIHAPIPISSDTIQGMKCNDMRCKLPS